MEKKEKALAEALQKRHTIEEGRKRRERL